MFAARYMDEFPALEPVAATALGDHRFDGRLDEASDAARKRSREFCRECLKEPTRTGARLVEKVILGT